MAELTPEKLFELTGESVAHLPSRQHYGDLPPAERQRSEARAEQLLVSLLDAGQRADYSAHGTFWVDIADGSRMQLGVLHRQIHELPTGPIARRELCVVPVQDHMATPLADVWTNLLLVLQSDPEEFLAVANVWTEERRSDAELARLADAEAERHPERRLTERQLAQKVPVLIEAGQLGLASALEAELARRLAGRGRYHLAVRCAVGAGGLATAAATSGLADDGATADESSASDTSDCRSTVAQARSLAPWLGAEPGLLPRLIAATHRRLEIGLPDDRRREADRRVAAFGEQLEKIVALTASRPARRRRLDSVGGNDDPPDPSRQGR